MKKMTAFSAVMVVAAAIIVGININNNTESAYALVSLDINPSIDIKVDRNNLVTDIIPLNEEASKIYDENMIGNPITEVMSLIISNAELDGFLNDSNNNILISSATFEDESAQLENSDLKDLRKTLKVFLEEGTDELDNVKIIYVDGNNETAEESLETGISLGRLELAKVIDDDEALHGRLADLTNEEENSVLLAENILVDDDSVVASVALFVSKLRIVPVEEVEGLAAFLELFDEENMPLDPESDYHQLLVDAKNLWKPVMHEYNVAWAHTNGNDEAKTTVQSNDSSALKSQEAIGEYVTELKSLLELLEPGSQPYEEIRTWLDTYNSGLNGGNLQEIKNEARKLVTQSRKELTNSDTEEDDEEDLQTRTASKKNKKPDNDE